MLTFGLVVLVYSAFTTVTEAVSSHEPLKSLEKPPAFFWWKLAVFSYFLLNISYFLFSTYASTELVFSPFPADTVAHNSSLTHFVLYLFSILLSQQILVSAFLIFGFQPFYILILFKTLIFSLKWWKNVSEHILWINPLKVYIASGYKTGLD